LLITPWQLFKHYKEVLGSTIFCFSNLQQQYSAVFGAQIKF
jgi:hypothetical protein